MDPDEPPGSGARGDDHDADIGSASADAAVRTDPVTTEALIAEKPAMKEAGVVMPDMGGMGM